MACTGSPMRATELRCYEPSPPVTPSTSKPSGSGWSSQKKQHGARQSRPRQRVPRKPLVSLGRGARNAQNSPRVYGANYDGTRGPILGAINTSNVFGRPHRTMKRQWLEQRLSQPQKNFVKAMVDDAIHMDEKCLQNLMDAEAAVASARVQMVHYHNSIDLAGIGASLRANAVEWLRDICREEHSLCDATTLPLAVSYMDRFLSKKPVPKSELQSVATACFLIANKMKAPEPIRLEKLVTYADGGTDEDEVMGWEVAIANALEWDFCTSTASEFFDQLLVRAPILAQLRPRFEQVVWSIQKNLLLAILPASVQALLCVYYVSRLLPPYAEARHVAKNAIRKFLVIGMKVRSYEQQLSDYIRFMCPGVDPSQGELSQHFFDFVERLQTVVAAEDEFAVTRKSEDTVSVSSLQSSASDLSSPTLSELSCSPSSVS
ncbi:CBN-CYD-1 protein [Aphelenchoides avenae]|nr:CBN-CYD-1 protein [Aphelenchus avenae]